VGLWTDPRASISTMARRERDILEHAVHTIAEQAVKADELVDEAKAAGGGDHPVTVHAKMLRLELLKVKADLERELEDFVLDCSKCGLDVHGSRGSASHRVIGHTGSPRRTASRLSKSTNGGSPPARGRGGRSSDIAEIHVVPAPYSGQTTARAFGDLLIDCEEDRTLRSVLVWMLAEVELTQGMLAPSLSP